MNQEDRQTLRARLQSEIGNCLSSDLRAHVKRGVVIVVSEELSLLEVAVAVAEDNTALVKGWIASERLKNPSSEQIEAWENSPDLPFISVIVRPYVLVQESSREAD